MGKNDRRHFHEHDPHFDGENEGPISDPTGGPKTGVRIDQDPQHPYERKNPYGDVTLNPNKRMEKFRTFFQK